MLQFVLTNILMVALGTVLYLIARSLPRIKEESLPPLRKTLADRVVMSEIPERLDDFLSYTLGKLFRKLKVVVMRFDNYLTGQLKKINTETNGNGKVKVDYVKEIAATNGNGNGHATKDVPADPMEKPESTEPTV